MDAFDFVDSLGKLAKQDKLAAVFVIIILILIIIISYRSFKPLQKLINLLSNIIKFIPKDMVFLVTFSKKPASFKEVIEPYLLSGYLIIKKDYTDFFNDDGSITKENLLKIRNEQDKSIKYAKSRMKRPDSIIYMGFPHVPLAFRDGYLFSDTDNPLLYEYQGKNNGSLDQGFFELKKEYNSDIKIESNYKDVDIKGCEIAIKIEQSYDIQNSDIVKAIGIDSIVTIRRENIKRHGITSYAQVDLYEKKLREVLDWAKNAGIKTIHIFATVPVSLAFSLGREIMHSDCDIYIYNYNSGKFDWRINIKNGDIAFT